jgi:hypothetical protein
MSNLPRPLRTDELEQLLSDRDIAILESLERFRFLTTRQVQRQHLPAEHLGPHRSQVGATRSAVRILHRLEAHGLVTRLARRIGGAKHGSAVIVWQLGAAGDRLLRARRGESQRRRYIEPGHAFLAHTLEVAELATTLLERSRIGEFDLLELEAEPTCWRSFGGRGGTTVTLRPDLLVVTADESTETHSFVEVDRATEHLPAVIRKCQTYQRHWEDGHEEATRGLYPAVVWIVPTELRADKLRHAIAQERTLRGDLFFVITAREALQQLAPPSPPETETLKGGSS